MFPYNRLNEIFDYVSQNDIVSVNRLSSLLNITDRTIRSDIQTINEIIKENGAQLKLKRKAGYYIEINDQEKYNTFLSSICAIIPKPDNSSVLSINFSSIGLL